MQKEYSKYLNGINQFIQFEDTEECKTFWKRLETKIYGLKIYPSDNTFHKITANIDAQNELEDLKEILLYCENLLTEEVTTRCKTTNRKIVNLLENEVSFEHNTDFENPNGSYIPTTVNHEQLYKKYKRIDFFNNISDTQVIYNVNNNKNINIGGSVTGIVASEVNNSSQKIITNDITEIVELIKENRELLLNNGIELEEVINNPTIDKLKSFGNKLLPILKVGTPVVEIVQKIIKL